MIERGGKYWVEIGGKGHGSLAVEEVRQWIDDSITRHPDNKPAGLRVSQSVSDAGLRDRYRGIRIAVETEWFPDDRAMLFFHPVGEE